eukprot:TRINITY_DN50945_c0_g1_i1.p1 TRINITY_DN50945_c0_g1~~TRINITY_DN50945_c0_g1_i1.p1  ORF type:complete len:676 (+),score=228.88 TRINITY_DN50945_c0_g1_i1:63-2030(+)
MWVVTLLSALQARAVATDWCAVTDKLAAADFGRDANISQMLRGREVRVVAFHEPPWAVVNDSLPEGVGEGKRLSGFEVALMLRIAEAGGFADTLKYEGRIVGENQSWTDALREAKGEYDLIAGGGWMDTSQRRRLGVIFTTAVENFGVVLAMRKPEPAEPTVWENAFFWVKPFTASAYLVVAVFAIVPAALLWVVEREDQPGISGVLEGQFMGLLAVTGFGDFTWAQRPLSRVIMMVWAVVCLVLVSSYTASLTSFLVVSAEPELGVSDADDFFVKGHTACIPRGWGVVEQIRRRWGADWDKQLLEVPPAEMSKLLAEGRCDGLLMQQDYMRVVLQGGPPRTPPEGDGPDYGCGATIVGPTEISGVGAFPAGLGNCRWFVVQVVDALIRVLDEQSVIEDLFLETLAVATRRPDGQSRCTAGKDEGGEEAEEVVISAGHLAGIVLIAMPLMLGITIGGLVVGNESPGAAAVDRDAEDQEMADPGVASLRMGGEWVYGTKSYRVAVEHGRLYFRQGGRSGELTPSAGWTDLPPGLRPQWRGDLGAGVIWLRYDPKLVALHTVYVPKDGSGVWRCTAWPAGAAAAQPSSAVSLGPRSPSGPERFASEASLGPAGLSGTGSLLLGTPRQRKKEDDKAVPLLQEDGEWGDSSYRSLGPAS